MTGSSTTKTRNSDVAERETIFELATSACDKFKSFLIVTDSLDANVSPRECLVRLDIIPMAEKRTCSASALIFYSARWNVYLPRPEGDEEAKPGEEEHASVDIEGVQPGDGTGFIVDRIDFRSPPK